MSRALWRHIKHARRVAKVNPLLGYELERSAVAVINPGVQKFEHNLENTITVLESLKEELEDALKMLDTEDAKEFARFFEDAAEAEEEELRQMLKKVSTTAGFKDYLDKFKQVFSPKGESEGDKTKANEPSYKMDDSESDAFVEGEKDWKDSSHYIEQEAKQNAEFFSGVEKTLDEMDSARKKPNRKLIEEILTRVNGLIKKGKDLAGHLTKGVKKELFGPPAPEGAKGKAEKTESKLSPHRLDSMVTHYIDMLQESAGNEQKTVKYLRELFHSVKPFLREDKAEIASVRTWIASSLIQCAYTRPDLRPHLLPVIYRLTGR